MVPFYAKIKLLNAYIKESRMSRFIRSSKVRFEDCDLAGIVFYPNYIRMLTRLTEDWFSEALGVPWGIMHCERKLGFPTVDMQVEFKKASRIDEMLEWSLAVLKLGSRSLTIGVNARCQGEERVAIRMTMVSVNLVPGGISSRVIPADFRAAMKKFLIETGAAEKIHGK